ncbi:MAG: D-alanine--poly(phosphoribitol) ligase subunit DltA [Lachnospiraceae bacterium]|jgi:D-alanine--poly(phosphoribitol) ligase subunit 1|nr:D-alanine--poly(phosphoribitol) ligase subunit DltA [Lachnospiraceae bacterium]
MSIIKRLEEIVKQKGEVIAFIDKDKEWTFKKLWSDSQEIRKKISNVPEGPILVYGANDYRMLTGFIGTSMAGHPYVPMDSHSPFERVKMVIEACNPSAIIITQEEDREEYLNLFDDNNSFYLQDFDFNVNHEKANLSKEVVGDETYYIIYTSGTTGVPKGVAVSHNNLETFSDWMIDDFDEIDDNKVLSQAPYVFDLSIFSLYPTLLRGGTIVSLSKEEISNFKLLFERLNSSEINTWVSTPSFVDICLLDPSFTAANHSGLKQFIFCGEKLEASTAKKLLDKFPEASVWNTYGPTEATGAISSVKITDDIVKNYDNLPIGKAKSGVEIRIQDTDTKEFVEDGNSGEIIIVGNSVANGYYKNEEKTHEAFFTIDGTRAYHTGDAGFIDEDGQLNYVGRIDFQIKLNGFRIELGDIENNLAAIDEVDKAVVLPKTNKGNKVTGLVAVISAECDEDEKTFTKYIKKELSKRVTDYMIPSKYVYMDTFPLNQNGKIDRKKIKEEVLGL